MKNNDLSMFLGRTVIVTLSDGSVYRGVGWQILFGEDKADDAYDHGIDSLLVKINEDDWTEYVPGSGDDILME